MVIKPGISGRGVFTDRCYTKGEVLTCGILEVSSTDQLLTKYLFPFIGTRNCIHIGFASFLNSSSEPNLKLIRTDTKELKSYFETLKDVPNDTELTLNY